MTGATIPISIPPLVSAAEQAATGIADLGAEQVAEGLVAFQESLSLLEELESSGQSGVIFTPSLVVPSVVHPPVTHSVGAIAEREVSLLSASEGSGEAPPADVSQTEVDPPLTDTLKNLSGVAIGAELGEPPTFQGDMAPQKAGVVQIQGDGLRPDTAPPIPNGSLPVRASERVAPVDNEPRIAGIEGPVLKAIGAALPPIAVALGRLAYSNPVERGSPMQSNVALSALGLQSEGQITSKSPLLVETAASSDAPVTSQVRAVLSRMEPVQATATPSKPMDDLIADSEPSVPEPASLELFNLGDAHFDFTLPTARTTYDLIPKQVLLQITPVFQQAADSSINLALNPTELGSIQFELAQVDDQLHVVLTAERPETLDLLRRNVDQLMQEIKQAGYSGASLNFGQWGQGGSRSPPKTPETSRFPADFDFAATPSLPAPKPRSDGAALDLRM